MSEARRGPGFGAAPSGRPSELQPLGPTESPLVDDVGLAGLTLRSVARRAAEASEARRERCDFCADAIPEEHRHVLDLERRDVACSCLPCSILFGPEAASMGRYRLIPDRRLRVVDFRLDDVAWAAMQIPVGIAFFVRDSARGRVIAAYPSPAGPTEAEIPSASWEELQRANPVVETLAPDVEALLVNRARGRREQFLAPIDDCFRLVAVVRQNWRGLSGGSEVWQAVDASFDALRRRSRDVTADGARPPSKRDTAPERMEVTTR